MTWIPIGILILGFIPMLMALLRKKLRGKFIESATQTAGTIETIEQRIGTRGSKYYVATINYKAGNEMIRGTQILGYASRNKILAGQSVTVLYNPNKTKKFILKDLPNNYTIAWILTGIIALLFAMLAFFLYRELGL